MLVVPLSMFLGDRYESTIIQWLQTEKALFFKKERSSPSLLKPLPENSVSQSLTAAERREVEECTKIFENMKKLTHMWWKRRISMIFLILTWASIFYHVT